MNRRILCGTLKKLVAVVLLAGTILTGAANAQNKPAIRVKETIQIERNGDSKFLVEMKFAIGPYTNLKKNNPNIALLMRNLGIGGQGWQEIRDIQGDWLDGDSTVKLRYAVVGMCRTSKDSSWEVPVAEDADLELSAMHENIATLTGAIESPMGIITSTTRVLLPNGSSDVRLLKSPARLAYRLPAPTGGSKSSATFNLEAKPQMMSSLAKSHADPKFNNLWVGRSKFENTGDQLIRDFKVRFRIVDFTSAWSPWHVCSQVVPGQTVSDAYFPVMDMDKITKLNGSAQVMLEAQFQYKTADGKTVEDTESQQLELLGHNTIFTSSLKKDERVGWHDMMNLGPIVLASFVTHEDPIIQQVAGWISGQAGGAASALETKEAFEYLKAINDFLVANEIKYQTAPFNVENGNAYQHVKYGRDVLRNRAGTCIDLAILWGSLCEAVGLKPVLFLIPGHCFPAVYLPNGELIAIESTAVGRADFKKVIEVGMKEMKDCFDGVTPHFKVDIKALHAQGVKPLEQPNMPAETLEKWGIKKVAAAGRQVQQGQQTQQEGRLAGGVWRTVMAGPNGQKIYQAFSMGEDGSFASAFETEAGEKMEVHGTYSYQNGVITLNINGATERGTVTWINANKFVYTRNGAKVEYTRTAQ